MKTGITTLHCMDGGEMGRQDAAFVLHHKSELPLRTVVYDQTLDIKEVEGLGLPRIGGYILADGAIENHIAALYEPYLDQPDNRGVLTYSDRVMEEFAQKAYHAGLQIAVHAIRDRAIAQVLGAYEKAIKALPRDDHRHRIEHLELPSLDISSIGLQMLESQSRFNRCSYLCVQAVATSALLFLLMLSVATNHEKRTTDTICEEGGCRNPDRDHDRDFYPFPFWAMDLETWYPYVDALKG